MLILPNSVFIHIPRTGGSYCKKAILDSIHGNTEWVAGHQKISEIPLGKRQNRVSFAFTRPPMDWYRSFFSFATWKNWRLNELFGEMPEKCQDKYFYGFLENVLEHCPGYATRLMLEWSYGVDITVPYSRSGLTDRLRETLYECGERIDLERFNATPRQNLTPPEYSIRSQWIEPVLEPLILEAEKAVIETETVV